VLLQSQVHGGKKNQMPFLEARDQMTMVTVNLYLMRSLISQLELNRRDKEKSKKGLRG
jgi:hypothetical protein